MAFGAFFLKVLNEKRNPYQNLDKYRVFLKGRKQQKALDNFSNVEWQTNNPMGVSTTPKYVDWINFGTQIGWTALIKQDFSV